MAEGRTKFGHDGFNERMKNFPSGCISGAENVAMNYGYSSLSVALITVNGWISSPGHHKYYYLFLLITFLIFFL
jgi:uncharacterized protein YkwD